MQHFCAFIKDLSPFCVCGCGSDFHTYWALCITEWELFSAFLLVHYTPEIWFIIIMADWINLDSRVFWIQLWYTYLVMMLFLLLIPINVTCNLVSYLHLLTESKALLLSVLSSLTPQDILCLHVCISGLLWWNTWHFCDFEYLIMSRDIFFSTCLRLLYYGVIVFLQQKGSTYISLFVVAYHVS